MNGIIQRELSFPQSPDVVWKSLTDPVCLADWMYPNDFEPRVGHRFTFQVPPNPQVGFEGLTVQCEVLDCVPPRELSFSWVVGELNTRVRYRLESEGAGTKVFFEHSGFEQPHAFKGAEYGWTMMHGKLTTLLQQSGESP